MRGGAVCALKTGVRSVESLAESLTQLPGTRTEVETIAESLKVGKGDLKLGLNATEKAVKQSKLDEYRVVYFATHGLVAGELQELMKNHLCEFLLRDWRW